MKGVNKIKLNQETVTLAIQEYLEKSMTGTVHLLDFKPEPNTYSPNQSYEATISDALPEQEPAPETKSAA